MQAREYFGSDIDLGLDNRNSVQAEELGLVSQGLDRTVNPDKAGATDRSILSQPQPTFRPGHQAQPSFDDTISENGDAVVEPLEDPKPIQASRADFYKYLITDGNWTDLFATSLGWMLLDFTFYLLGVNSSSFVPTMFGEKRGPSFPPYQLLLRGERHILESTSIGALLGSILAIATMHYFSRRKIQTWGFVTLGALFAVVGALYITLPTTNAHAAIVVFYGICQLFYNFGTLVIQSLQSRRLTTSRSKYDYFHRKYPAMKGNSSLLM